MHGHSDCQKQVVPLCAKGHSMSTHYTTYNDAILRSLYLHIRKKILPIVAAIKDIFFDFVFPKKKSRDSNS